MKKIFTLVVFCSLSICLYAQQKFVKGYYIGNDNTRVECLISNWGWSKCPQDFTFKLTDTSAPVTLDASAVREFGIYGSYRFISEDVMIDLSSMDEKSLSEEKIPVWTQKRLFLSVLIDGEASLYQYRQISLERFFYRVNGEPVKQLIYRKYISRTGGISQVMTDFTYRRQLWEDVHYPDQAITSVDALPYEKTELVNYFKTYHGKIDKPYTAYTRKTEKASFHLNVTPGFNYSMLTIFNDYIAEMDFKFDGQFGFRIGIEPELVFPYTHKKLSLALEPTFEYFNGTATNGPQTVKAKFYTIDIPIGLRYYMFLGKNVNIFGEGFITPFTTIPVSSDIRIVEDDYEFKYTPRAYFALGAGMNWKRLGIGIRYNFNRKVVWYNYFSSKYSILAVILRFRIL